MIKLAGGRDYGGLAVVVVEVAGEGGRVDDEEWREALDVVAEVEVGRSN